MSLSNVFAAALARLDVEEDADARTLRRAYRKAARNHPPDRDPEGFRAVRDAYELLSDPIGEVEQMLHRDAPAVDPPALPPLPERGATALQLLRRAAGRVSVDDLWSEAAS